MSRDRRLPGPCAARLTTGLMVVLAVLLTAWPWLARAAPPDCPPPAAAPPREGVAQDRDRGFLWQLRRDGRSSWLYGTLHVGRVDWQAPGPRLRDALQAADALVLELDPLNPGAGALQPEGPTLALSPVQRQRLRRQLERLCATALADAPLHPTMLLMVASLLGARADGLEAAYGAEVLLSTHARRLRKPVLALETMAGQLDALLPRDLAAQAREFEQQLLQLERRSERATLLRLVHAWDQGRLDELERWDRWCGCLDSDELRAQMKRLLDDRHPAMADRIEAWHRGGRSLLVAVGALHLVGPRSLRALLEQRGFEIERIELER